MWIWRKLIRWAVSSCSKAGDGGLTYFYDYFAREYREERKDRLLPAPAAMFQAIKPEDVKSCRGALKKSFAGYRDGGNAEVLKRFFGEYREYVSICHDEHAKDRYNAFVYRYMMEAHVGSRAIAAKLGVVKETVQNYIGRCMDEMLMLCMGIPATVDPPEGKEATVYMLIQCSRIFCDMTGDYIFCLFPGKKEKDAVQQGRRFTRDVMEQFADAVKAYSGYCKDGQIRIDTDIRKAEILEKCIAGVPPAAIAEECGCCESTVYADIRENERRLAAMLFYVKEGIP